MGLFGKKEREPCAICGGKVPALFPSPIDNPPRMRYRIFINT